MGAQEKPHWVLLAGAGGRVLIIGGMQRGQNFVPQAEVAWGAGGGRVGSPLATLEGVPRDRGGRSPWGGEPGSSPGVLPPGPVLALASLIENKPIS